VVPTASAVSVVEAVPSWPVAEKSATELRTRCRSETRPQRHEEHQESLGVLRDLCVRSGSRL